MGTVAEVMYYESPATERAHIWFRCSDVFLPEMKPVAVNGSVEGVTRLENSFFLHHQTAAQAVSMNRESMCTPLHFSTWGINCTPNNEFKIGFEEGRAPSQPTTCQPIASCPHCCYADCCLCWWVQPREAAISTNRSKCKLLKMAGLHTPVKRAVQRQCFSCTRGKQWI